METIRRLETTVATWYKNVPHLPEGGRKWLATNVWWIVLVGVILSSIGILGVITATFFAGVALTAFGGVVGAAIGGVVFLAAMVIIAFMAITVILGALAIPHLKALRRKGWMLLFIILLIQVAETAIAFLFSFEVVTLLSNLFFAIVGGYFLFEIHGFYAAAVVERSNKTKAPFPASEPKTNTK
jgi:hypothetical protein